MKTEEVSRRTKRCVDLPLSPQPGLEETDEQFSEVKEKKFEAEKEDQAAEQKRLDDREKKRTDSAKLRTINDTDPECYLLRLPDELKDEIYKLTLDHDEDVIRFGDKGYSTPVIVKVCQEIRDVALPICWKELPTVLPLDILAQGSTPFGKLFDIIASWAPEYKAKIRRIKLAVKPVGGEFLVPAIHLAQVIHVAASAKGLGGLISSVKSSTYSFCTRLPKPTGDPKIAVEVEEEPFHYYSLDSNVLRRMIHLGVLLRQNAGDCSLEGAKTLLVRWLAEEDVFGEAAELRANGTACEKEGVRNKDSAVLDALLAMMISVEKGDLDKSYRILFG